MRRATDALGVEGRVIGPDPTVGMSAMRSRPAAGVLPSVVSTLAEGLDCLRVLIEPDPGYEPFDSDPAALAAEVEGLRKGSLAAYVVKVAIETDCGHLVCSCGPLPPTVLDSVGGVVTAPHWAGSYLPDQVTNPYLAEIVSDLIAEPST